MKGKKETNKRETKSITKGYVEWTRETHYVCVTNLTLFAT